MSKYGESGEKKKGERNPEILKTRLRRESSFVSHMNFRLRLPEISTPLKSYKSSEYSAEFLSKFHLTTMENNDYKKILLADNITFDFMPSNARVYDLNPDEIPILHSDDEAMMQEDEEEFYIDGRFKCLKKRDKIREKMQKNVVSNKNFKIKTKKEIDVSKYLGVNPWIKKTKTKKGRLEYIKYQFELHNQKDKIWEHPDKHKKRLKSVKVFKILPDFKNWPKCISMVKFQGHPCDSSIKTMELNESIKQQIANESILKETRVLSEDDAILSMFPFDQKSLIYMTPKEINIEKKETYEMSQYKILREYWFKHVEEENKKTCVLINKDERNNVWNYNFLESQYITRKQICEHFRKEFNSDEVIVSYRPSKLEEFDEEMDNAVDLYDPDIYIDYFKENINKIEYIED